MNRGLFGTAGALTAAFIARLTSAETKAANAATAAAAAQAAADTAGTDANNLSTAVTAGNDAHTALHNRINGISIGTGRIAVALLLNGTVDVVVTFATAMPDTNYTVKVPPTAGFTFGTAKAKTKTTVTIPVTAGLALAVGASFTVLVIPN
jgi:hypothetical protein